MHRNRVKTHTLYAAQGPFFPYAIVRFAIDSPLRNFSYLVADRLGQAWAIDPDGAEAYTYATEHGWKLSGICNTHAHPDHTRGNAVLQACCGPALSIAAHADARVPGQTQGLSDGQLWGPFTVRGIAGHSACDLGFLLEPVADHPSSVGPVFFTGDVLFHAGVGNCRNGGDVRQLYATLQQLSAWMLPETRLLTGHDYGARNLAFARTVEPDNSDIARYEAAPPDIWTWADEKRVNPFLRLSAISPVQLGIPASADDYDRFVALRAWRDKW